MEDRFDKIEAFYKTNPIKISGGNISIDEERRLKSLTESNGTVDVKKYSDRLLNAIEFIEMKTREVYEEAENDYIPNPMRTHETEGVEIVDIPTHTYCHVANVDDIDKMKSFGVGGFLASEWFGIPESEGEAPYCTFVRSSEDSWGVNRLKEAVFYFDTKSPLFQKLVDKDFFKYRLALEEAGDDAEQVKRIKQAYGEYAEAYDAIIDELNSQNIVGEAVDLEQKYKNRPKNLLNPMTIRKHWRAIPGGIPPELVCGIQVKGESKELNDNIEEIKKIFPNATIFNEHNMVIHTSNEKFSEQDIEIAKNEKKEKTETYKQRVQNERIL